MFIQYVSDTQTHNLQHKLNLYHGPLTTVK